MASSALPFGMKLRSLRVKDFRALAAVELDLEENLTLLIGENNCGKTSVLAALNIAARNTIPTPEDFFEDKTGVRAEFCVDLLLQPTTGNDFHGDIRDVVGGGVRFDDETSVAYIALRTRGILTTSKQIEVRRSFLRQWKRAQTGAEEIELHVSRDVLDLITFSALDAQRDLVDDLRNRRTTWADVARLRDVEAGAKKDLEAKLGELGDAVVAASGALTRVRDDLADLGAALALGPLDVQVQALPRKLDDLVGSMNVSVVAGDGAPFKAAAQGMGARSLASLLVFRSAANTPGSLPPERCARVSAFEEPEAHLHPQAQRSVVPAISRIGGQKIITTHSPFLSSVAPLTSYRVFRRAADGLRVLSVKADDFPADEVKNIERFLLRRRGDALFARAVGLFEGDTEDILMRRLGQRWWSSGPDAEGIALIGTEGSGKVKFIGPALGALGVPWTFFCDGDREGQAAVKSLPENWRSVAQKLPEGSDIEKYLADTLDEALVDAVLAKSPRGTLDEFIAEFDGKKRRGEYVADYQSPGGRERARVDLMRMEKLWFAAAIGDALAAVAPESWPEHLRMFFIELDSLAGTKR